MRNGKSRQQPEKKEDSVVIPDVVCHTLDEKGYDAAEKTDGEDLIAVRYGVFAEGQNALCENENEEQKREQ